MANRPTQRSMQDLLEKQLVSLNEIHGTLTTSKLIELGQLAEEKKTLDDDNILVEEMRDIHAISTAILESLNEIKNRFLAMPITTNEDKSETAKMNEAMLKALQDLGKDKDKDEPLKDIKEGLSLGPIIAGIGIALAGLAGIISSHIKNIKFWISLLTPEFMKKKLSNAVDYIGKIFRDLGSKLKELFDKKIKSIGDIFENSINKIKSIFQVDEESKISKVFKWLKTGIKNFFAPFEEAYLVIKELIGGPVGKVKGIFTSIGDALGTFTKMFKGVFGIIGKLMLPVTILMTAWDTVKGAIEGYEQDGVLGAIQGAVEGLIKSVLVAPLDMLREAVAWIAGMFGFENAQKELESFDLNSMFEDLMDAITSPILTLKLVFSKVKDFFIDSINSFIGMLQGIEIPKIGINILGKDISIGPFQPFSGITKIEKTADTAQEEFDTAMSEKKQKRVEVEKVKDEKDLEEKRKEVSTDVLSNAETITPKPTDVMSNAEAITPKTADVVAAKTTATEVAKEDAMQPMSNTVVSAPTVNTSNKTIHQQSIKLSTRNPDSTSSRYISSCYAIS
jgi:hypothetical protein